MPIEWKSEEMKKALQESVLEGKSFGEAAIIMAKKIGQPVNRNQMIGAYHRIFGKKNKSINEAHSKYKAAHDWTTERDTLLRTLYAEGRKDHEIAFILNEETGSDFIYRAVENRRRKLGLQRAIKQVVYARETAKQREKVFKERKPVVVPVASIFPDKPKTGVHDYAVCKWIDGDPKGRFTVCAQPAAIDSKGNARSWCPHHCSIVYIKPGERRPEPARFA